MSEKLWRDLQWYSIQLSKELFFNCNKIWNSFAISEIILEIDYRIIWQKDQQEKRVVEEDKIGLAVKMFWNLTAALSGNGPKVAKFLDR